MLDISAIFAYILPYFYHIQGSIFAVVLQASLKAALDWFRLGRMYLMSIISYLVLVVAIISTTIWSYRVEKV